MTKIEIYRIVRSAASCVNISRILSQTAKTPIDQSTSILELSIEIDTPIKNISMSPEGNYLATLDERNYCRIYQLGYDTKLVAKQIQLTRLNNVLSISMGRAGHFIVNYPKRFRLLAVNGDKVKEYQVRHPDTVTYYAWRLSDTDDQLALLTICHRVLRIWRRRPIIGEEGRFTFQLAGAKLIPSDMEFTWLQNRFYNPSDNDADYLISVFEGAIHFWSVSGLETKQNVIISTLRTIPGVYPFHSECSIQVRFRLNSKLWNTWFLFMTEGMILKQFLNQFSGSTMLYITKSHASCSVHDVIITINCYFNQLEPGIYRQWSQESGRKSPWFRHIFRL